MKRILATILGAFSLAQPATAEPQVQRIDPSTILFTTPTISDDAPPVEPLVGRVNPDDIVFHEDEWRQIEFFPRDRLEEVQAVISELKAFEAANRTASGWRNVYVRRLAEAPVLSVGSGMASLERSLGVEPTAGPVVYAGANSLLGRVSSGFSMPLGGGVVLYGRQTPDGVAILGAIIETGSDNQALVQAFGRLNQADGLVLVDWRAQMVITSMASTGDLEVWRP